MFFEKIKKNINLYLDKKLNLPHLFPIRLSDAEKQFFTDSIKNAIHYLEFGSGGSTFLTLLNTNAKIISVESDKKWIKYISTWKIIKNNINKRLEFLHIDIGKTGEWGFPTEPERNLNKFPNYSKLAFENHSSNFDTVFIDGRFRVACALQTILNCPRNTKILIHDFTDRSYYHDILKFLSIEKSVETMVLLTFKDKIDKNEVSAMYDEYKYDYR